MQGLTEDEYLFEERAAIIEFCGNVPRHIAEQEARKQIAESKEEQRRLFDERNR